MRTVSKGGEDPGKAYEGEFPLFHKIMWRHSPPRSVGRKIKEPRVTEKIKWNKTHTGKTINMKPGKKMQQ